MVDSVPFGRLNDGSEVRLYRLASEAGVEARITDFGCAVTSLIVTLADGESRDVVLGYSSLKDYLTNPSYLGVVAGRCANRIAAGRFSLSGKERQLSINHGRHHLHGGKRGFSHRLWRSRTGQDADGPFLMLEYASPDGEEGYPGNLDCRVTYRVTGRDLRISYHAVTDSPTIVNLTNHAYLNLSGDETILDHLLEINAEQYTPVDADIIPTGEIRPVKGTPLDFKRPRRIGERIDDGDEQLIRGGGYDHNWVLNKEDDSLTRAARLISPDEEISLEVWTTEPGMQFYAGNFLSDDPSGKEGRRYGPRGGLCLETQHFPDAPNHADFPSIELKPGEVYRSETVYRFPGPG